MFEIDNLYAGYSQSKILKGLKFKVEKASITGIIGLNGSGKSTLLKSIFNHCEIHKGKITCDQQNITQLPTFKKNSVGLVYVPQNDKVFPNLTIDENLKVSSIIKNNSKSLERIYSKFNFLKSKKQTRAQLLSGGQQQILAIAMALLQRPKLLILDEPFAGLGHKETKEIHSIIKSINKEGVTIILVEQNTRAALQVTHQIYALEQGKLIKKY